MHRMTQPKIQECIPVGCVLSAAVAVGGVSAQGGVCPEGCDTVCWRCLSTGCLAGVSAHEQNHRRL